MNKCVISFVIGVILILCLFISCKKEDTTTEKQITAVDAQKINAFYCIKNVDISYFKEIFSELSNDDKKSIATGYSMSSEEQQDLFKNPQNYYLLNVTLTVDNDTDCDINNIQWKISESNSSVWWDSDSVISPYFRSATAHSDSTLSDVFVVKSDTNFATLHLANLTGTSETSGKTEEVNINTQYGGYARIVNQYPAISITDIDDITVLKKAFLPVVNESNSIKLSYFNSKTGEFSGYGMTRKFDAGYYAVVKFLINGTVCYGISFFDNHTTLIGGMLVSKLQNESAYGSLTKNKSTFAEVKKIDPGTYAFENGGGKFTSFHWLSSGYIQIEYTKNKKGELIVTKIERKDDTHHLLSQLLPQDRELLGNIS